MKRRSYTRTTTQSVDPSSSTQSVLSILAGFDPKDPASVAAAKERAKAANKLALLKMNSVQEQFVRCHNKQGRMPRTRLFEGANQSGKTTLGVCEDLAHAMGYRPWLIQTRVEDGKVKHYMDDPDCRLRIKVPNVGMVGCEVAGQTLAQRIEPLFKELIPPQCEPE